MKLLAMSMSIFLTLCCAVHQSIHFRLGIERIWNERLFINDDGWVWVLCVFLYIYSFYDCFLFSFCLACKLLQTHPNSSHKKNLLKMDSHELYSAHVLWFSDFAGCCCIAYCAADVAITTHSPVNEWIHYMHWYDSFLSCLLILLLYIYILLRRRRRSLFFVILQVQFFLYKSVGSIFECFWITYENEACTRSRTYHTRVYIQYTPHNK